MAQKVEKKKIVICGGGNAAHVYFALANFDKNNDAFLFSSFQEEAKEFKEKLLEGKDQELSVVFTQQNKVFKCKPNPNNITKDPACLKGADLVVISLPAFAHNQYLQAIKKNTDPKKDAIIAVFPGASGLECDFQSIFGKDHNYSLLSCITLPWAARILNFGQRVEVLGIKESIEVCVKASGKKYAKKDVIQALEKLVQYEYKIPSFVDRGHLLNMTLGAVNAIIHPSIMYTHWKNFDGKELDKKPLFYQGISKEGAEMMTGLSDECIAISKAIEKETSAKLSLFPIVDWYKDAYKTQIKDKTNLYTIIRTNAAYKGLTHPCKKTKNGKFLPDFKYRYLTEDLPYGLAVILGINLILAKPCKTPILNKILNWGQKKISKEYFIFDEKNELKKEFVGKNIKETRAPQRYGFKNIKEIV